MSGTSTSKDKDGLSYQALSSHQEQQQHHHQDNAEHDDSKCQEEVDLLNKHYRRNYIAFWFLGMINNFHYCLVLSAADQMATDLHLKKLVALQSWALVFFGLFVRMLNAFVYNHWSYNVRFLLAGLQTLIGIIVVSASPYIGHNDGFRFALLLMGIVAIGNGSSYGESVALGYVELFPSSMVGGWSSGTGMSGVLAALVYLGLSSSSALSNSAIFLLSIPLIAVYWCMYFLVLQVPFKKEKVEGGLLWEAKSNWIAQPWRSSQPKTLSAAGQHGERQGLLAPQNNSGVFGSSSGTPASSMKTIVGDNEDDQSTAINSSTTGDGESTGIVAVGRDNLYSQPQEPESCCRLVTWWRDFKKTQLESIKRLHRLTFANNLNLCLVYIFEYAIQFVAPFSFPCELVKKSDNFFLKHSFVITQFCYQLGVLCSRSSLSCFRVRRVVLLTIGQGINAVLWFIQAKTLLLSSSDSESTEGKYAAFLFCWMIFVGFFGGASYVNVFFNILEQTKHKKAIDTGVEDDEEDNEETEKNGHAVAREDQGTDKTVVDLQPQQEVEDDATIRKRLKEEREMSMNIGALYAVAGITGGSLIDVIFSNAVLTRTC